MAPAEAAGTGMQPANAAQPDDAALREFAWSYQDSLVADDTSNKVGHHIIIPVRRSVYDEFRSRPREASSDAALLRFVTDGVTDEVRVCAYLIAQEAAGRQLSRLDVVSFVLAFSRDAIPYARDEDTHGCAEYCNFPIETLYEQRGDCEDHAILTAAVLVEMGFDACLVTVRMPDGSGHAAVAVCSALRTEGHYLEHEGRRYYYCEATPEGDWRFGEVPSEYLQQGVELTLLPMRREARIS